MGRKEERTSKQKEEPEEERKKERCDGCVLVVKKFWRSSLRFSSSAGKARPPPSQAQKNIGLRKKGEKSEKAVPSLAPWRQLRIGPFLIRFSAPAAPAHRPCEHLRERRQQLTAAFYPVLQAHFWISLPHTGSISGAGLAGLLALFGCFLCDLQAK